ncbi:putative galactinol--sucrose galactosyltransferase [Helianthus annuus]|nr:putative galactinol--sucrose galactosyltransferase [Helianthus annuus]KAJ0531541.1 putative galactinol--sucrose galactosyltransferase [Helianthus annuus]
MAIQTHNLFFNQSPFINNTQFTPIPISSFTKFTLNSSRIRPTFIQSSKQDTGSVLDHIEKTNKTHKEDKDKDQVSMTIGPVVQVSGRSLVVKDRIILSGVSENVVTSSGCESGQTEGGFIGAVFEEEGSRHVASLGRLNGVRFMACFRFKLWWMAQKMGDKGSEVPNETQFLLMETVEEREKMYVVFLPLVEGSFRACLQGSCSGDELEVCVESGDVDSKGSIFSHTVYVGVGTDPFSTVTDAINKVKLHLKSFKQRQDKKLPGIVDCFGWCTWDAFYQDVTQEGVESGLKSLADGGTPAKFVIIDDGWQSVGSDDKKTEESEESKESQPLMRLTGIKENEKFQSEVDPSLGIKNIVNIAKNTYGLKYVYVWHAIVGYWGGVRPEAEGMEEYGSSMKYPKASKGVIANDPVWKTDMLAVQGLGLMDPKKVFKFYDNLHRYLAAAGVDGVKVDVQCILETLGSGLGGRVALTQQYHQALDASIARNFPDNGCIACMSHNTDALYCSQQTAVVRASDDFYPRDPVSHTIHIASVAFNSVFLGEFMQPDWDMFHSLHPAAEYHASARAISGGPIYVSDAPGKHNFDLLKKLVLPDWSGDCVMYRHHTQDVIVLPRDASIPLSLHVLEHEVFTVTPIKVLGSGLSFGPLGLIDMFNSGGAVDGLEYSVEGGLVVVSMMVKGCGRFGAYSKTKPKRCVVGPSEVEFAYDSDSGLVVVGLSHMPGDHKCHHIKIHL